MDSESQKFLEEIWATASTRKFEPNQTNSKYKSINFSSATFLKLDSDSFVLTLEEGKQNRALLWIMAMYCELGQHFWCYDATILFPNETPQNFAKNNLHFIVPVSEDLNYMRCMKESMRMIIVDKSESAFLFKSVERVIAHINRWIHFIGLYLNDLNRATIFLNFSLEYMEKALNERVNEGNKKEKSSVISHLSMNLNNKSITEHTDLAVSEDYAKLIDLYDDSQPLALIESGKPLPNLNTKYLHRYIQTSLGIRKIIVSEFPQHQALIQRDKAILKKL